MGVSGKTKIHRFISSVALWLLTCPIQGQTAIEGGNYVLQLAAYRSLANAEITLATLNEADARIVKTRGKPGDMYLILSGSFLNLSDAQSAADEFQARNPDADYWIRNASSVVQVNNGKPPLGDNIADNPLENDIHASAEKSDEAIHIEDDSSDMLIIDGEVDTDELIIIDDSDTLGEQGPTTSTADSTDTAIKIDELWTEYGYFPDNASAADHQGYLHGQVTGNWSLSQHWELQASARVDAYYQQGDQDSDSFNLDYGESYIRYAKDKLRVTAGAQKVIWGRIDEFPPTDHLSTQDISRFILDDLSHRRRASPAIRFEYFSGNAKLDAIVLPYFRGAELPERDSVWFPINTQTGEIISLESTEASRELVKNTPIDLDEPNSDGGFGFRFSNIASQFDYAITVQKGRQSLPYFSYDPARDVIESRYPRSSVIGGDIGFEALGGTLRFEAAWFSDTPLTKVDGTYTTTESVSWGGALELFPGDGDARLNLQLTGTNMLDAPSVLNRTEVYAFNGTYDVPFANETWRFKVRFYTGLNERDLYLNPEIAYKPTPSQETYLGAHYFDGSKTTSGGFHQNNSVITLGWRGEF